jgi:hypothetical protein
VISLASFDAVDANDWVAAIGRSIYIATDGAASLAMLNSVLSSFLHVFDRLLSIFQYSNLFTSTLFSTPPCDPINSTLVVALLLKQQVARTLSFTFRLNPECLIALPELCIKFKCITNSIKSSK